MSNMNELFKDAWNIWSNSSDEPYKNWIRIGFEWCYKLRSKEIRKLQAQLAEAEKEIEALKQTNSRVWSDKARLNEAEKIIERCYQIVNSYKLNEIIKAYLEKYKGELCQHIQLNAIYAKK